MRRSQRQKTVPVRYTGVFVSATAALEREWEKAVEESDLARATETLDKQWAEMAKTSTAAGGNETTQEERIAGAVVEETGKTPMSDVELAELVQAQGAVMEQEDQVISVQYQRLGKSNQIRQKEMPRGRTKKEKVPKPPKLKIYHEPKLPVKYKTHLRHKFPFLPRIHLKLKLPFLLRT
uniref:Uncharacterized protein n=1 Tax=Oryza rufipogon TaxID=4529 RepID=A0A679BBC6_ORYRU|nr:hypothetical protein [Oryza rufipogon]